MPASSAKAVQFTHEVVAACDDQVDLDAPSFTFDAKYTPPATVLFNLSIALAGSFFYLQFTPSHISSLKKTTCQVNDKTRPACFDAIRHCWGSLRSLTRLEFELCDRGRLITPIDFDRNSCDDETRRALTSMSTVAAASAFSLYMPPDVLTNATYQPFFQAWRKASAPTDLRNMYNGKGGALLSIQDQERLLSSSTPGIANDVPPDAGHLPGVDLPPPAYDEQQQRSPPPPSSQAETASESETATVATPTPPGYRRNEGYPTEKSHNEGHRNKREWSSEDDDVISHKGRNIGRQQHLIKRRAVGLDYVERIIEALEGKFQERIESLEAEVREGKQAESLRVGRMEELEARVEKQEEELIVLRSSHEELECQQEEVADAVKTMDAHLDELARDLDGLRSDWVEEAREYMEDGVKTLHEEYLQGRADKFIVDMKDSIRKALGD
ncbi:hypothetical protein PG985_001655 [Apiospora marii]|uniref:uncharacterized protein n=1 Tax=Apiospora marii TaxID=335849 RepID=UPI00312F0968